MIELPKPNTIVKVERESPRRLIILSRPKVGKTTAVMGLPNHLLLDFEDGSEFVEGTKINIRKIASKENIPVLAAVKQIADSIAKANKEAGSRVYDHIVLDTATSMEDLARELATILYKKSTVGKDFKGTDVVSELEYGAGYLWLRRAFDMLYSSFDNLAEKSLILLGHVKDSSIKKDGKDLSVKDINLTGKLKHIVCADADGIGYMYREKNNTMISFVNDEEDIVTGARSKHLRDKTFKVCTLNDDGTFSYNWESIFID